jgi:hypothetical protein
VSALKFQEARPVLYLVLLLEGSPRSQPELLAQQLWKAKALSVGRQLVRQGLLPQI